MQTQVIKIEKLAELLVDTVSADAAPNVEYAGEMRVLVGEHPQHGKFIAVQGIGDAAVLVTNNGFPLPN